MAIHTEKRQNKNKDVYLRALLIILQALDVLPHEFFSDPAFNSLGQEIDFE